MPRSLMLVGALASLALSAGALSDTEPPAGHALQQLRIKQVTVAPRLEDFASMKTTAEAVDNFVQRLPKDGEPVSERTESYLSYDDKNLYVVFVCHDRNPKAVHGHLTRREDLNGEDVVMVYLDTFRDHQRAYVFAANPMGIQQDGTWTENGGLDTSFDTVWESRGIRTNQGFVVWMSIPFKSLRFPRSPEQSWGLVLQRKIARKTEDSYWPRVSAKNQGTLTHEGTLVGLESIAPNRNVQLTPYGIVRSFKELSLRDPNMPHFESKAIDGTGGLDAKYVLKDSFVIDATFNPDFSQVESDEPQATANQRFEVFFPEKRPFFLENADFFQTAFGDGAVDFNHLATQVVFTRRINNPEFGIRLTGKRGPYSIGLLGTDDRSPTEALQGDPSIPRVRARYLVARLARDIGKESKAGLIFTERDFAGSFNRVSGVDARFSLNKNWVLLTRALASQDKSLDSREKFGTTIDAELLREGLHLRYDLAYYDASPNYVQRAGFFRRPDIRRLMQIARYRFRPTSGPLTSWGPRLYLYQSQDHSGLKIDQSFTAQMDLEFKGTAYWTGYLGRTQDVLRPQDFPALTRNQLFNENFVGTYAEASFSRFFAFTLDLYRDNAINFDPLKGPPVSARHTYVLFTSTVHPRTALTVANTYLLNQFVNRASASSIFTNHIIRSKWNYQVTPRMSGRLIVQYSALLANPGFTSLHSSKTFNVDVLFTYLVHPGTALYVGYNNNLNNYDPALRVLDDGSLLRSPRQFINDSRQFFVKMSYQFRF